jgi:tetratricopeptide (TPR) repeat protein/predicted Ser/Thr protein kinase
MSDVGNASSLNVDATIAEGLDEAPRPDPGDSSLLSAGTQIGHYLVLERLGAGAMGVVYSAYDPRLDRRVAIKLLRAHRRRGGAKAAQSRLLREAQALAKLKDPHVVVVHDVGRHEDQVFVAMEFVDGLTLKDWMAQERSVEEVLSVFLRAGEGLAAAHRAGLVHRDFKPDNVMLDTRGRPRVMDFGLARAAEDEDEGSGVVSSELAGADALATPLTQTGAVMGTPAYMAPEQHLGLAADARSDQFAYCVALYEALYGKRPFAGNTVAQIGLAVTSGEIIEAPRDRPVPSWLKSVLHRGLSVDAKDRFADMDTLLAALRDDPAVRRRRWMAIGGSGGGLAALVGGLLWMQGSEPAPCQGAREQIEDVWSAEQAMAVREAFAATERSYAESTAGHVVEGLDEFSKRWTAVHREACEATRIRKERSEELMDRQMSCLERGRTDLGQLVQVLVTADGQAVDRAIAALDELPDIDACGDLERVLSGVQPPSAKLAEQVEAARAQISAAAARRSTGDPTAALEVLASERERVKRLQYAPLEAEFALEEGRSELFAGRYAESAAALERAYVLAVGSSYEVIATESSAELIYIAGYRLARHQAAETWSVNARAWAQRVDPGGPLEALVLHNAGVLLDAQGHDDLAEPVYREALQIRTKAFGPKHPLVAKSTHNLGNVFLARGDYEEAALHYARARDIYSDALGADHPRVAGSLNNLGVAARGARDFAAAVEALRRSTAIYERSLGAGHPDVALSLDNLALALIGAGEVGEARVLAQRALEIRIEALGAEHPDVGDTRTTLAEAAIEQGEFAEAIGEASLAVTAYDEAFGPDHPQMGIALDIRGRAYLGAGQLQAARKDLLEARRIREAKVTAAHRLAQTLASLARAQRGLGEDQAALETRDAALKAYEKAGPAYADLAAELQAEFAAN